MSTDEIDTLIERYLDLLDQYTKLKAQLNSLQSSIHLNISRANFTSDRGLRYGQDFYDERMQASRRVVCAANPVSTFSVVGSSAGDSGVSQDLPETESVEKVKEGGENERGALQAKDNPLRWFGILTPQTLRQAQNEAVQMVEAVIPALASKDAELKDLEIQIRRARKHHAKAEAAERKLKQSLPATKESITT